MLIKDIFTKKFTHFILSISIIILERKICKYLTRIFFFDYILGSINYDVIDGHNF